jgi:hypothetical protein
LDFLGAFGASTTSFNLFFINFYYIILLNHFYTKKAAEAGAFKKYKKY